MRRINKKCSTKRDESKPCRQLKKIPPSEENVQTVDAELIAPANLLPDRWNKTFDSLFLTRSTNCIERFFEKNESGRTSNGIERALRRKTLQILNAPIKTYQLSTSALNLSTKYSHFSLP